MDRNSVLENGLKKPAHLFCPYPLQKSKWVNSWIRIYFCILLHVELLGSQCLFGIPVEIPSLLRSIRKGKLAAEIDVIKIANFDLVMIYDLPHSNSYLVGFRWRCSVFHNLDINLRKYLEQPCNRVITGLHPKIVMRNFEVLGPHLVGIPKFDRTDGKVLIPPYDIVHHALRWCISFDFDSIKCYSLK